MERNKGSSSTTRLFCGRNVPGRTISKYAAAIPLIVEGIRIRFSDNKEIQENES